MSETVPRRAYRNPPIEEALVEFQFAGGTDWDPTLPGKLHQHATIASEYPGKPRQQQVLQPDALGQGATVQQRVQLVDAAAMRMISLGPNVLSVHCLRPYEGWTRFRRRVETALAAHVEVAGRLPVTRVGVRYINKIVLPLEQFELSRYFEFGPRSPKDFPVETGSITSRVEYSYSLENKLVLTLVSVLPPAGASAFVLDVDEVWLGPTPIRTDDVMPTVDRLHALASAAFEASITDETRKSFDVC